MGGSDHSFRLLGSLGNSTVHLASACVPMWWDAQDGTVEYSPITKFKHVPELVVLSVMDILGAEVIVLARTKFL